jgi:hypothetical protein
VKEEIIAEAFIASVDLINLRIKFICIMLQLLVRWPVQIMQHIYEDLKKEKTIQYTMLKYFKR